MAQPPTLNLDLLHTLLLIAEEGSFTRAAERAGRTQSTVSLQVQRLEAAIGQPVILRSKGAQVELTPAGNLLVERAKEMMALNDKIFEALGNLPLHGSIRLGAPADYSQVYVQRALSSFAEAHPAVTVEIETGASCELVPKLKAGMLDLMLCEGGHEPRQWPVVELWRAPLWWITSEQTPIHLKDPLPLSLAPGDCPFRPPWLNECVWRGAALRALEQIGRRHQIVSTSSSLVGQQAAVLAGLAVTVSTGTGLPLGLRVVQEGEGLPPLPDTRVLLVKAPGARQPLTDALATTLIEHFRNA